MALVATDPHCSVTLDGLRRRHTVLDLIVYLDMIDFWEDREAPTED